MSALAVAGLVTVILLGLLAIRIPVAYALLLSGAVGLILLRSMGFAVSISAARMFEGSARYSLVIVPLFIAMGIYAKQGTLATDGFELSRRVMGRVPGGLAMATILTCAGFAAISGSSVATVATVGPVSIREMRRHGYSTTVAAGVVGAAGTLGVLIPPSIFLVLYGILVGESIGAILIAGIIPGVLSMVAYLLAIFLRARYWPQTMGHPVVAAATSIREAIGEDLDDAAIHTPPGAVASDDVDLALSSLGREPADSATGDGPSPLPFGRAAFTTFRVGSLFFVVVGGIYLGFVTAVEAAALGVLLTIVYFVIDHFLVPRRERVGLWRSFRDATREAVELNSMVFALIVGAGVFTFFLVLARVPQGMASWIVGLPVSGTLIVILILLAFIPMGMFLDSFSMLLIAVPLMYPVVTELGYDGIWFGIMVVKLIEVGIITPPFGINAFVVAGVSREITVDDAFRGLMWFVPVDLALIALLFVFPGLVLWLPQYMA